MSEPADRSIRDARHNGTIDAVAINRATYDQIAGDYHERTGRVWPELPASVAEFAGALPGDGTEGGAGSGWVADVGCGPGRDIVQLRAVRRSCTFRWPRRRPYSPSWPG